MARYIPHQKDIISLRLPSGSGGTLEESQKFLVLSATAYNKLGKCIICPISQTALDLRTEVRLPISQKTKGVVIADQCRSIDWQLRWPKKWDQLNDNAVFRRVTATLQTLMELPQ